MQKALYRFARTSVGKKVVGMMYQHFNKYMPVNKIFEDNSLTAFYHPQPSYSIHILIVPNKSVSNFLALENYEKDFYHDLVKCVAWIVDELNLSERGYRLIVNGGAYQEIPQLHFHLVSD